MKDLEDDLSGKNVNLTPLFKSIEELEKAAANINSQREVSFVFLRTINYTSISHVSRILKHIILQEIEQRKANLFIGKKDHIKVRELNDRLMMAERAFTDQDGLLGRSWFKHLVCLRIWVPSFLD